jgi:hypothetical protein
MDRLLLRGVPPGGNEEQWDEKHSTDDQVLGQWSERHRSRTHRDLQPRRHNTAPVRTARPDAERKCNTRKRCAYKVNGQRVRTSRYPWRQHKSKEHECGNAKVEISGNSECPVAALHDG